MSAQSGTESYAKSGLQWLEVLGNAVVDLLFPPHCVGCARFGAWLCDDCAGSIAVIRPPVCSQCGAPFAANLSSRSTSFGRVVPARGSSQPAVSVCAVCRDVASNIDGIRTYGWYRDPLREAIHQFKYEGLTALAGPLGTLMSKGWAVLAPEGEEIDVIVPVPLHPGRLRRRGYDQAFLLAEELARDIGRPVMQDALIRTKATAPQVGLSAQDRRTNVEGAFRCADNRLDGSQILLIDDVYTTGSTLEAAAAALREGGAASVWAYTLARAG